MEPTNSTGPTTEFRPHAVIICEREIPSPIWVAGILGVRRLLVIDFDVTAPPSTFVEQAQAGLRKRMLDWSPDGQPGVPAKALPGFGALVGIIINFQADLAIRYDLNGNAVQTLARAYSPGSASLSLT